MNYLLEVCLVALVLTTNLALSGAAQAPGLRKGVSVEMAVTRNAVALPDADREDALIVALTHNGRVYLGVDLITPTALAKGVRDRLSNQTDKKLYLKADARTEYANVASVLAAVRAAGVEYVFLLTSQPSLRQPGVPVPPSGLEVRVGARSGYGQGAAEVRVLRSGQQGPELKVNNKPVTWSSLENALRDLPQARTEKVILVSAEEELPFSDVVNVIDTCHSIKAEVVLVRPGR